MEPNEVNPNQIKQRHGCVTAWLILMIIMNSLSALAYLAASDFISKNLPNRPSAGMLILLGILGLANVGFAVMLFQWKKVGFWGFVITSIIALFINLSIGLGVFQSIFGLIGIAILYGILQIKKDNITTWENLE